MPVSAKIDAANSRRAFDSFSFLSVATSDRSLPSTLALTLSVPKYLPQEMSVGEAAIIPALANDDKVHRRYDEHPLIPGADGRDHISGRFPA